MNDKKVDKVVKLSEIEDKRGFLYRIAKARLDVHGVYFCSIDGMRVQVIDA